MNEQLALAQWSGGHTRDISTLILSEDVSKTAQWIQGVPTEALSRVEFRGVNLLSACASEFQMRWDDFNPQAITEAQQSDIRALFVAYVRVATATERFIEQWKPTSTIISAIHDPMAHAYLLQTKLAKLETSVFSFDPDEEAIVVESLSTQERYMTKLVLEGIASMRSDPRTWGPEVTAVVHEVLTYLGYAPDRVV
jgi:hypothetical protein